MSSRETGLLLLRELLMLEMAQRPSTPPALAEEAMVTRDVVFEGLTWLAERGLVQLLDSGEVRVTTAGLQFTGGAGRTEDSILCFLPRTIDDLHARFALLRAGVVVVDEFRAALVTGAGRLHARGLLPPDIGCLIDDRVAVDLFAAAVALVTRLSHERPAGSLAEELLTAPLVNEADVWLDMATERGALGQDAAAYAREQVRGVFALIRPDTRRLFAQRERMIADDALIARWFDPLPATAPTGYLRVE